MTYIL